MRFVPPRPCGDGRPGRGSTVWVSRGTVLAS